MEQNTQLVNVYGKYATAKLSNHIVNLPWGDMKATELKLLFWLMIKIDSIYDAELKEGEFSIAEINKEVFGWTNKGLKNYEYTKQLCLGLSRKQIKIDMDTRDAILTKEQKEWFEKRFFKSHKIDGRYYLIINFFQHIGTVKGEPKVYFKLSDDLIPFLLNLQGNFTKYRFSIIKKFSSAYSIRLYSLILMHLYQNKEEYKISLAALKMMLCLPDTIEYKSIKQRILKPAILDINVESDIEITNTIEIKEGRKVVELVFEFRQKGENKRLLAVQIKHKWYAEKIAEALQPYEGKTIVAPSLIKEDFIFIGCTWNENYDLFAVCRKLDSDKCFQIPLNTFEDVKQIKDGAKEAQKVKQIEKTLENNELFDKEYCSKLLRGEVKPTDL